MQQVKSVSTSRKFQRIISFCVSILFDLLSEGVLLKEESNGEYVHVLA